jgi:hypothetical protein
MRHSASPTPRLSNKASRIASLSRKGSPSSEATAAPTVDLPLAGKPLTTKKRCMSGLTDPEFSCEHPPEQLSEEKLLEGRREVAGYDARVFVSWNDGLGRSSITPVTRLAALMSECNDLDQFATRTIDDGERIAAH